MSKYLITVHSDGAILANEYLDNEEFELEDLQGFVGGYIETVPTCFGDDVIMLVNEEGKLKELPYNEIASEIQHFTRADLLFGDAVLVRVVGEDFDGFDEERKEFIMNSISEAM